MPNPYSFLPSPQQCKFRPHDPNCPNGIPFQSSFPHAKPEPGCSAWTNPHYKDATEALAACGQYHTCNGQSQCCVGIVNAGALSTESITVSIGTGVDCGENKTLSAGDFQVVSINGGTTYPVTVTSGTETDTFEFTANKNTVCTVIADEKGGVQGVRHSCTVWST
jgi:hypothetical protein